jgi:putative DNA primase/helicase
MTDDDDDNIIKLAQLQDSGELPPRAEEALALAFAARHEADLRHVAKWGKWLRFDGTRWLFDDTLHAFDLVREICREAALDAEDSAAAIASAKTVAAVERLARADRRIAATVDQFDVKPWLLNAGTRSYDLRTGNGRDASPTDYLTKRAGCAVALPGTPHPLWSQFLERITAGDRELQAFLQRYVGYCCTGLTSEHVFIFCYGTGANGKSTFINTIAKVFGEYTTTADTNTFLASRYERHPADLAKLQGARLVIAQETEKGRRWDENKIKSLTGGDRITARFMRQDYFDFTPTFKLFIVGNHKPRLRSVDEAMRRRLLLVPFTVEIPPNERDKDLPLKLMAERRAVLRWCIDGCLQWQQMGLAPPQTVRAATDGYFEDHDTLQLWLDECTHDGGQHAFTRTADLFSSWKTWCEERNLESASAQILSEALVDRGFEKGRDNAGRRGFTRIVLGKA